MKTLVPIIKKFHFVIVFALLALIIIEPFRTGFFFLIDTTYPIPLKEWATHTDASIGWFFLNAIAPFILTPVVAEKLSFFLALFFLGVGGFQLTRRWGNAPAYFAGLLAIFNPFIYARILDGQISLVISFTLFLWGVIFILRHFESISIKNLTLASVLFGLGINFLPHGIFIIFIILLALFIAHFPRKKEKILKHMGYGILAGGIILLFNLNWILIQLFFPTEAGVAVNSNIDMNHFMVFASEAGKNLYFNTLSLHGYWGEGEYRFLPSTVFIKNPEVNFLAIFFLVMVGLFYGLRQKKERKNTAAFLAVAGVAYILSMGIASPHFGFITQWLYDHVYIYKALREPQKWSGALLMSYLYFSALGMHQMLQWKFIRKSKRIWIAIIVALPIFYTSAMPFAFMGQLRSIPYPQDWHELREELFNTPKQTQAQTCEAKNQGRSHSCYDVLMFPWHQYMSYRFIQKNVSNPLRHFFYQVEVLQGDNIEIGPIYSQSIRPESKIIESYIGPGSDRQSLAGKHFLQDLVDLGIDYVLVAKEVDWEYYDVHLKDNPGLESIWNSDNLIVYQIHLNRE